LLYRSEDKLYRLDLNSSSPDMPLEPLLLAEHVTAYDISGSDIYIIDSEDKRLYRFGADEERPDFRPVADTPQADTDLETTLIVYDEYRIAILSENGKLMFFNAYTDDDPLRTLADRDIRGVQFSDDGKKLLFFSSHETSVYFIRPWEVQPKRDQNSIWQIGRFADDISFVQWTKDYEHILYAKGAQVFVTELDNRDRRNISELIRFERPPLQVLSRVSQNQIFFVKDTGDSSELLSIDFPEFNNFFTQ
jgi:WD40 repeat protein